MSTLVTSTLADLTHGCALSYTVSGSDVAHIELGRGDAVCELVCDTEAMRTLATLTASAMAEMDALFEGEQAVSPRTRRHQ
jgi:hypothetical protein